MKLPYLQDLGHSQVKPLLFSGLNLNEMIDDTELSSGINLDTELLPAISPRQSSSILRTLASPQSFQIINNKQVYIDGTSFFYDGVNKGTVTLGNKSIVDFNGNVIVFPDKKYYDYVEDKFEAFTCPYDIDYATVHYNRVFGIKGSNVYASKVGDFKVWDDYSGTEMDSWAADVYSPGDFTGITSYQDHVVFFKSDQMYELYGYTPSQFKILEAAKIGCIDNKSISEVGGVLFFMSEKGVLSYNGGFPKNISEQLNLDNIAKSSAIGDGRKYYVSIDGVVYIYDTWRGTWMPYIDLDVVEFGKAGNDIYALAKDGKLYKFESGEEIVDWQFETKLFDDGTFLKKSIRTIRLRVQMELESELLVYVSYDEKPYVLKKHIKNTELFYRTTREVYIQIAVNRAATYKIKVVGKGKSIVYGEKELVIGSDR